MLKPLQGETRRDFVARGVPVLMRAGDYTDRRDAIKACHTIFDTSGTNHTAKRESVTPSLPRSFGMVLNQPLAVLGSVADTILAVLAARTQYPLMVDGGAINHDALTIGGMDDSASEPTLHNGIMVIPVEGELVHTGMAVAAPSGLTDYPTLRGQIARAGSNDAVKKIQLHFDTPGGHIAGLFETADLIAEIAKVKPVIAIIDEMAASAGYVLAAACSEIVCNDTSGVGSIGVVAKYRDDSEALAKQGIKVTTIKAGDKKFVGGELDSDALAEVQKQVESRYEMMLARIARYRGMDAKVFRETEGAMYDAKEALALGLIDRIGSLSTEFQAAGLLPQPPQPKATNTTITAKGQGTNMDIIKDLCGTLGLSVLASEAENVAQISASIRDLQATAASVRAFCTENSVASLDAATLKIASAADPTELANLRAQVVGAEATAYVDKLMADGKLIAAKREWAVGAFTADPAAFKALMEDAPVVCPAAATPAPGGAAVLKTGSQGAVPAAVAAAASAPLNFGDLKAEEIAGMRAEGFTDQQIAEASGSIEPNRVAVDHENE